MPDRFQFTPWITARFPWWALVNRGIRVMHFNIFPMWHLFTALACRVFCRSSVGLQAVCSGLGMGEGEVGYFERT